MAGRYTVPTRGTGAIHATFFHIHAVACMPTVVRTLRARLYSNAALLPMCPETSRMIPRDFLITTRQLFSDGHRSMIPHKHERGISSRQPHQTGRVSSKHRRCDVSTPPGGASAKPGESAAYLLLPMTSCGACAVMAEPRQHRLDADRRHPKEHTTTAAGCATPTGGGRL